MKTLAALLSFFTGTAQAEVTLKPGDGAPNFSTKTDRGEAFDLSQRKGKWTVLYFYPKDDTPGCTKQACAFRDSIDMIRKKGADVFGVSKDSVESHEDFRDKFHLSFPLLADPEGKIISLYGASGLMGFAKRWTFIIDPELKIRWVQKDVDPAMNARDVAAALEKLQ